MAIKDWKKVTDNKLFTIWENKKIKQEITLFNSETSRVRKNTLFIDDIEEGRNFSMRLISKNFKTKSQALRYAKNYMRRN